MLVALLSETSQAEGVRRCALPLEGVEEQGQEKRRMSQDKDSGQGSLRSGAGSQSTTALSCTRDRELEEGECRGV